MLVWSDYDMEWAMGQQKKLAGVTNGRSSSHKWFLRMAITDQCIRHILDASYQSIMHMVNRNTVIRDPGLSTR